MKPLLLSILALLLAGCGVSPESYLVAHPDTPPQIVASMRRGDVIEGMTREQVRLVWGAPDSVAVWSEGDSWSYNTAVSPLRTQRLQPGERMITMGDQEDPFATSRHSRSAAGKPKRMLYFRGDHVTLVERASGGL